MLQQKQITIQWMSEHWMLANFSSHYVVPYQVANHFHSWLHPHFLYTNVHSSPWFLHVHLVVVQPVLHVHLITCRMFLGWGGAAGKLVWIGTNLAPSSFHPHCSWSIISPNYSCTWQYTLMLWYCAALEVVGSVWFYWFGACYFPLCNFYMCQVQRGIIHLVFRILLVLTCMYM